MNLAPTDDFDYISDLLYQAFLENPSTDHGIKQDKHKEARRKALINYCLKIGYQSQGVYLSEDRKSAAIMFKQSNKKVRVRDDLLFVRKCSGLKLLPSILRREKLLSRRHPKTDFYYLWFLGVHPENQGKGYGSRLLEELCQLARKDSLPLYLETSSEKNIAFYRKNGLELYDKLTFDFDLYLFKMEG